jgi:hypothetical protein
VHSRWKRYWHVDDRKERLETISLTVPCKRGLTCRVCLRAEASHTDVACHEHHLPSFALDKVRQCCREWINSYGAHRVTAEFAFTESPQLLRRQVQLVAAASPRSKPLHAISPRRSLTTAPALQHPYTLRTSRLFAMFSSKLTRAVNRATNITTAAPAPAQWTAAQCFATTTTQRRPHQRRQSSSKASCPPDSNSKPAPAAKAAENTTQASDVEKTPKRASRIKRTQLEKTAKGKEEASQFAGLPTVPDTRHVVEKGRERISEHREPAY